MENLIIGKTYDLINGNEFSIDLNGKYRITIFVEKTITELFSIEIDAKSERGSSYHNHFHITPTDKVYPIPPASLEDFNGTLKFLLHQKTSFDGITFRVDRH